MATGTGGCRARAGATRWPIDHSFKRASDMKGGCVAFSPSNRQNVTRTYASQAATAASATSSVHVIMIRHSILFRHSIPHPHCIPYYLFAGPVFVCVYHGVTPHHGTPYYAMPRRCQCGTNEWTATTAGWDAEWQRNRQMPALEMQGYDPTVWPDPKSPWPSWHR